MTTTDATRTYAPGPWRDDGTGPSKDWYLPVRLIRSTDDTLVCEIPYPDWPVHLANAHLIIAAPDLYVACLAWATYVDHQGDCEWAEAGMACRTCYRLRGEARRQHEAAVATVQGATR